MVNFIFCAVLEIWFGSLLEEIENSVHSLTFFENFAQEIVNSGKTDNDKYLNIIFNLS